MFRVERSDRDRRRRRRRADESTSRLPFWVGPAIALLLVLIVQALVVKLYAVPSGSMEETLDVGDRILVERIVPAPPERGEVIVFEATPEWGSLGPVTDVFDGALRVIGTVTGLGPGAPYSLVKRVIGLPGEEVACCDAEGRVTVDGEPLDEPYLFEDPAFEPGSLDCTTEQRSLRCFGPVAVPDGEFLVLGDHRSASADSVIACRGAPEGTDCARFVPEEQVVGLAFARVWPLTRLGAID